MLSEKELRAMNTPKKNRKKNALIALAVLFLIFFGVTFILEGAFYQEASWVQTKGQVTERKEDYYFDIGLELWTWRYDHTVSYVKENGEQAEGQIQTETAYANAGETVDIIYDPNGDGLRFGELPGAEDMAALLVARYVLLGAGVLTLVFAVLKNRKQTKSSKRN